MTLALIRKEAREHWLVLGLVLGFDALVLLGILIQAAESGGRFTGLLQFAEYLGGLSALVAANRLFTREYAGRTQLFLEVLPIGRARIFATKWLLGFAYMTALTLAAWFATWLRALRTEVIPTREALHVLWPVASFMLAVWSFASMAGMLGRYRYTAWIALWCIAVLALQHGKLRSEELPIMRLLGPNVAMARAQLDGSALLESWAYAACFGAAAAILALAGSGAIASALAQKMTARERVFVLVAALVGLFAYETVDKGRSKQPYTVADAIYASGTHVRVGVLRREEISDAAAQHMAQTLAGDMDSMLDALGSTAAPPVFVLPQRGLDPWVVERAKLDESDGIVLRAAPDVVLSRLRTRVLHETLVDLTRERALREDRHVLLDGFSAWWALRANGDERERRWLRAAASQLPVTEATLTRWAETQERVGACVADGLAFATVTVLARSLGSRATAAFARSLFSRPPDDFRVLFERPPAARLQQAGITWSALAARTEAERQQAIRQHATALSRIAQLSAAITVEQTARQGARIEVGLTGADAYVALYAVLGPWDGWRTALSRLDVRAPRATLPLSAPPRAHVLVAIETDDTTLGCPVRALSRRLTLP